MKKIIMYARILGWTIEKIITTPFVALFCMLVEGSEIFLSVFEDEYWRWKAGITEIRGSKNENGSR